MSPKKKRETVIAVCIQEPNEDGSSMDFGAIDGDNLRFLHQAFISDTIRSAASIEDADIRLYYIKDSERIKLVNIVAEYLKKKVESGNDFKNHFEKVEMEKERWGIRIEKIFDGCFEAGYKNVLIVGSRTPTVSSKMLNSAIKMLKESDAVFGPTPDGRYYVIGMSSTSKIRMSEFDWKSPTIYHDVADSFTKEGLAWSELEIWYCVENTEDLEMAIRDINQLRFAGDDVTSMETEKVLERLITKLES